MGLQRKQGVKAAQGEKFDIRRTVEGFKHTINGYMLWIPGMVSPTESSATTTTTEASSESKDAISNATAIIPLNGSPFSNGAPELEVLFLFFQCDSPEVTHRASVQQRKLIIKLNFTSIGKTNGK
ncbi:unnamed protein product [Brassica oleracea]